jgi:hypothetical protein
MKKAYDNLSLFIEEQKKYFDSYILQHVNFSWDSDAWSVSTTYNHTVFASNVKTSLNFNSISIYLIKGIYIANETPFTQKKLSIGKDFSYFLKAMAVYRISRMNNKVSIQALYRDQLLLKRVYIRMVLSGITEPHPVNINLKIIKNAMVALHLHQKNQNQISDSQTAMAKIVKELNHLGIILNPITYKKNTSRPSEKCTKNAKAASSEAYHSANSIEETNDDEHEKLITINTFMNIVASRNFVTEDTEKILLNMLLLLIITGFRFNELSSITIDSLKRLEVADPAVRKILVERGLPEYYLGIRYIGEKNAGQRTYWVEPFAIHLVESIYKNTIDITDGLRRHIIECRNNNFASLLPLGIQNRKELLLDDVVKYVLESISKTANERGMRDKRDKAKKALSNHNIKPIRKEVINRKKTNYYYLTSDINQYLKKRARKSQEINDKDFIFNIQDTSTGQLLSRKYENLLFICKFGSTNILKTLVHKSLPTPVDISIMSKFLGSKQGASLFSKYDLLDTDGLPSKLQTHMPRHTINTFLAIAGISEHLQAAMMGRVDISQNEHYQHLAINERALSTDISLFNSSVNDQTSDTQLTPNIDTTSPIELIKKDAVIGINPELTLKNGITQNTHTFTTIEDKSDFFKDLMSSELDIMNDMAETFNILPTKEERNDFVERHADLHPLDLGSCMRKLLSWSCPYSMKCQDGTPCPYFTVTGRADEPNKLKLKIIQLESHIKSINELVSNNSLSKLEALEILNDLNLKSQNFESIKGQSNQLEHAKKMINLLQYDSHKKPRTLATLFALEHRKMEDNNEA